MAIAGSISTKVLGCRSRNQLLRMLWLGGAARCEYEIIYNEINQGYDTGNYGQPLIATLPVLQLRMLLIACQANHGTNSLA